MLLDRFKRAAHVRLQHRFQSHLQYRVINPGLTSLLAAFKNFQILSSLSRDYPKLWEWKKPQPFPHSDVHTAGLARQPINTWLPRSARADNIGFRQWAVLVICESSRTSSHPPRYI